MAEPSGEPSESSQLEKKVSWLYELESGASLKSKCVGNWIRARQQLYVESETPLLAWAVDTIQVQWRKALRRKALAKRARERRALSQGSMKRNSRKRFLMEKGVDEAEAERMLEEAMPPSGFLSHSSSLSSASGSFKVPSKRKVDFWAKARAARKWTAAVWAVREVQRKINLLLNKKRTFVSDVKSLAENALLSIKTEVDSEKERAELDFRKQGNDEYYTNANLVERYTLMQSPAIRDAVSLWWHVVTGGKRDVCKRRQYFEMSIRIQLALVSGVTLEEAEACAEEDWDEDSEGKSEMDEEAFFRAMFQLADLWVDAIEEEAYVKFLENVLTAVANVPPWPPTTWRSLDKIRLINPDDVLKLTIDELSMEIAAGGTEWLPGGGREPTSFRGGIGVSSPTSGESSSGKEGAFLPGSGPAWQARGADAGPGGKSIKQVKEGVGFGSSTGRSFAVAQQQQPSAPEPSFKAREYKPPPPPLTKIADGNSSGDQPRSSASTSVRRTSNPEVIRTVSIGGEPEPAVESPTVPVKTREVIHGSLRIRPLSAPGSPRSARWANSSGGDQRQQPMPSQLSYGPSSEALRFRPPSPPALSPASSRRAKPRARPQSSHSHTGKAHMGQATMLEAKEWFDVPEPRPQPRSAAMLEESLLQFGRRGGSKSTTPTGSRAVTPAGGGGGGGGGRSPISDTAPAFARGPLEPPASLATSVSVDGSDGAVVAPLSAADPVHASTSTADSSDVSPFTVPTTTTTTNAAVRERRLTSAKPSSRQRAQLPNRPRTATTTSAHHQRPHSSPADHPRSSPQPPPQPPASGPASWGHPSLPFRTRMMSAAWGHHGAVRERRLDGPVAIPVTNYLSHRPGKWLPSRPARLASR